YFEGILQTTDWIGQDGVKRYRTEIVVENMIMLDNKGGEFAGGASAAPRNNQSAPENIIEIPEEPIDDEEIRVENIPF
ncbi:MAG: single-stranded DNA-binding protein, partial [Patescibacteria group bacterium]